MRVRLPIDIAISAFFMADWGVQLAEMVLPREVFWQVPERIAGLQEAPRQSICQREGWLTTFQRDTTMALSEGGLLFWPR